MKREIKFRVWDGNVNLGYKMSGSQMRKADYHPYANKRGYVPEHRLIMENLLQRYLKPRIELIHHLNKNRSDNRIENLVLMNPKDHAKGHTGSRNPNGTFVCVSKEFQTKKFRLYDVDRNIVRVYSLNELISKTYRRGKFEYRGEFTGLKDKNGVEIYFGDILATSNSDEDYDMWNKDEYGYTVVKENEEELGVRYTSWAMTDYDESVYYKEFVKVIGNTYQNPELIK